MNYQEQIETLKQQFNRSFNFYILKNNYGFSDDAKTFLDDYNSIISMPDNDLARKYQLLAEHITKNQEATVKAVKRIPEISKLWEPNYKLILDQQNNQQELYNLEKRSKTVCDSLKNIFEDQKIRQTLTDQELYSIYGNYYQISSLIKSGQITYDHLTQVERNLSSVSNKIWSSEITKSNEYVEGEPFKFIVHNTTNGRMSGDTLGKDYRHNRLSTSLISSDNMALFGAVKHGFILPYETNVVAVGYDDLGTFEKKEGDQVESVINNGANSSLITPTVLNNTCRIKNIQINGEGLNYDNGTHYNEILLENSKVSPTAIYCVTFGEKDLSWDYQQAKKLSEQFNLPLIDIDIALYRSKDNKGSYLTDTDSLTPKEQREFAKNFLNQYWTSRTNNQSDLESFVEADLNLYKGLIVDNFLEAKREAKEKGIPFNAQPLFSLFESQKEKFKLRAEDFNNYVNEAKVIAENLVELSDTLAKCTNEQMKQELSNKIQTLSSRIQSLNKLAANSSNFNYSPDNIIYQSNHVVDKIFGGFTPFTTQTIEINGQKMEVITGYKTETEIEQEKQQYLSQVDKSNIDLNKRRNDHAKKVIEIKSNAYKTNATNIRVNDYVKPNPELDSLSANSKSYAELVSLNNETSKYEELSQIARESQSQLANIEQTKRIIDGESSFVWLQQMTKEVDERITKYSDLVKADESKLAELRTQRESLSVQQSEQNKKGALSKMFSSSKIDQLNQQLSSIDFQIETLENTIKSNQFIVKSEEDMIKGQRENFLNQFALDGMSLEQYQAMLAKIKPNAFELTDMSKKFELEDRLFTIQKKISELPINEQNKQESLNKQDQLMVQLGLKASQPTLPTELQNVEDLQMIEEGVVKHGK